MAVVQYSKQPGAVPSVVSSDTFVSEARGLAYLSLPKVMSRSIIRYLADTDPNGYSLFERGAGKEALGLDPATGRAPQTFTFVRNPYSRAVSFYQHMIVNYLPRYHYHVADGLRPDMTFSEFVDWLGSEAGTDRTADTHFLSQAYFVFTPNEEPGVDYVGKFEDAVQDMAAIQERLGLPTVSLPELNRNSTRAVALDTSRHWRDQLDNRTIRILTRRYETDLEAFGYERLTYKTFPVYLPHAREFDPRPLPPVEQPRHRNPFRTLPNTLLRPFGLQLRRLPRTKVTAAATGSHP